LRWTSPREALREGALHGLGIGVLLGDALHPSSRLREAPIADFGARVRNFLATREKKWERPHRRPRRPQRKADGFVGLTPA
jgi:hypothetical protein